jgi:hypothetical protein
VCIGLLAGEIVSLGDTALIRLRDRAEVLLTAHCRAVCVRCRHCGLPANETTI